MTSKKNITCIGCPLGCGLDIKVRETDQGPEILDIAGFLCNRGKVYGRDEIISPRRMITSLIHCPGTSQPLSVRTSKPIAKELIFKALEQIHKLEVELPVRAGDILIEGLLDTDVALMATCDLPAACRPGRTRKDGAYDQG